MGKKAAMGRGLDAIFDSNSTQTGSSVSVIRIADIEVNREQPRKTFDEDALLELSQSIAAHGVIQPIVVKNTGDGFYKIIAGERRYRAAKTAGLTEIPAIIMELDDRAAAEVAVIENIQRESLNALEEATAYKTLTEAYGMTQEELARRIGKSRSTIANMLRILELPDTLQLLIRDGKITAGHAKALLGLKYKSDIESAAQRVVSLALNVRATESLVRKINDSYTQEAEDVNKSSYTDALQKRIFDRLGRKVKISSGKKRTLEISYETNDDLEELLKQLCGDDIFDF